MASKFNDQDGDVVGFSGTENTPRLIAFPILNIFHLFLLLMIFFTEL